MRVVADRDVYPSHFDTPPRRLARDYPWTFIAPEPPGCLARCSLPRLAMANVTRGATRGAFELEPEVLLPSQFYGRSALDASLQPEKRLMLAVMEDAVGTFQKYACAQIGRAHV